MSETLYAPFSNTILTSGLESSGLSIWAHFHCTTNQQPHPLAKESVLLVHKSNQNLSDRETCSRITGSNYGVLITQPEFSNGDNVFVVLDWKTGEIMIVCLRCLSRDLMS